MKTSMCIIKIHKASNFFLELSRRSGLFSYENKITLETQNRWCSQIFSFVTVSFCREWKYKKKSIPVLLTFCLFQPASSSAIYISIYVLCFLWSVRMVDWTDGFQPHLEDLEGETERGGRPRPLLDSPCSSLFWFLLLSLISAVCQLPSHITDAILSLFVSFAHFFPPPRLYILLQLIHIIILSSYLHLFLHSHPFFLFFFTISSLLLSPAMHCLRES